MSYLRKRVNKLFRFEDLTPQGDGSYLLRWTLLSWGARKVYLHKIMATDWAREPHDHPKDFISIGLYGRYTEELYHVTPQGWGRMALVIKSLKEFKAPWFRRFPAETIHRLRVEPGEHCWTLVFVGVVRQGWGFFKLDGTKISFKDFMREKFGWT